MIFMREFAARITLILLCARLSGGGTATPPIGACVTTVPTTDHTPPLSVLPVFDEALNNDRVSLRIIENEYKRAMHQCNDELKRWSATLPKEGKSTTGAQLGDRCRGNAELYRLTGMILMPFGPSGCEVNSLCWVGILGCGEPVEGIGRSPDHSGAQFAGWSVGSLHVQMVVQGREIIAPAQKLLTRHAGLSNHSMDAIIAPFVPTVAGAAAVAARLLGWYRGRLFRPPDATHYSDKDIAGYEHLGGLQFRCDPFRPCGIPYSGRGCLGQDDLRGGAYPLTVTDTGRCPGPSLSVPLPLCRGGSNYGRYLALPEGLTQLCGAHEYIEKIVRAHERTKDKSLWAQQTATIKRAYLEHIHSNINVSVLWTALLRSAEGESYRSALTRYHGGNPCVLVDLRPKPDSSLGRAALYAPYSCKYRIFDTPEAASCLRAGRAGPSTALRVAFDGDSMARELFAAVLGPLGRAEVSAAALKTEMNANMSKTGKAAIYSSSQDGIELTLVYSWEFRRRNLLRAVVKTQPDVYITNYAALHNMGIKFDLNSFQESFKENILKFWANESIGRPRISIYQSCRDNHGMRDPRFVSEAIRQADHALRRGFVETLGFVELNEYLLTAGMVETDHWANDGWHVDFEGTVRKMESMILLNIICN